jgi:hypothetical protein
MDRHYLIPYQLRQSFIQDDEMDDNSSDDKPLHIPESMADLSEQCSELATEYVPDLNAGPVEVPEPETDDESDTEVSSPPIRHPKLDISRNLKPPKLAHVRPHSITYEQAHGGINVQIPGTAAMHFNDVLVFYWGLNKSSTRLLLRSINKQTTVRVLCISYDLMTHLHYGAVEVYYEVHRGPYLVGVSPILHVTVGEDPTPPKATRPRGRKKKA